MAVVAVQSRVCYRAGSPETFRSSPQGRSAYDGLPRLRHETLAEPGEDDIQLVAVDREDIVWLVAGRPAHEVDLGPAAYEVRACYVDPDRWRPGSDAGCWQR